MGEFGADLEREVCAFAGGVVDAVVDGLSNCNAFSCYGAVLIWGCGCLAVGLTFGETQTKRSTCRCGAVVGLADDGVAFTRVRKTNGHVTVGNRSTGNPAGLRG